MLTVRVGPVTGIVPMPEPAVAELPDTPDDGKVDVGPALETASVLVVAAADVDDPTAVLVVTDEADVVVVDRLTVVVVAPTVVVVPATVVVVVADGELTVQTSPADPAEMVTDASQ